MPMASATELDPLPRFGLLLAGGGSTRMGRDKALLEFEGRPLIEHMRGLLAALPLGRVLVSGRRPGFQGIEDLAPGRGPLAGIASVAIGLPDCQLLVLPLDMPRLQAGLLQRLLDAPPAACVRFAGLPLPMRLRVDAALRAWLRGWLEDAQAPRALHRLQAQLSTIELEPALAERPQLQNCNTPEQWKEVCP
jgi:molybdenum cofactor guanylyltransferase